MAPYDEPASSRMTAAEFNALCDEAASDFVTIPREEYELLCEGFLDSYEENE